MTEKFEFLRDKVRLLRESLKTAELELAWEVKECRHDWTQPKYDPIIREGYTSPGDPPGTMGSDWRGPVHVPRSETKRWKRECKTCGEIQYTSNTDTNVTETPKF
jgi:hypothetical protein